LECFYVELIAHNFESTNVMKNERIILETSGRIKAKVGRKRS
jgi:hypothetical protein